MQSNFDPSWVDLSLSFTELTSLRGHHQPYRLTYGHRADLPLYAAAFLPIHILTHLDLPWHAEAPQGAITFDLRPREFDAVILDFRHKQLVLQDYLMKDARDEILASYTSYLDFSLIADAHQYEALIRELSITSDEIQQQLSGVNDWSTLFLLFRTDWALKYNRFGGSFNNTALEGQAAFLLHPYVNEQTLLELQRRNVTAIGHDLHSLGNPLYWADGEDIHPLVREARENVIPDEQTFDESIFHNAFLRLEKIPTKGEIERFYLKNLNLSRIRGRRRSLRTEEPTPTFGKILIVPIPVLRDSRGVACEAFFLPMRGSGQA